MSNWKDWVLFLVEIIKFIIMNLPKMGYEAARSMAVSFTASKYGISEDEIEDRLGKKINSHFGRQ